MEREKDKEKHLEIGKPEVWEVRPKFLPAEPAEPAAAEAALFEVAAEELPAPAAEVKPKAVWVTHGMGQQIKFETLDQVVRGLQRADARAREKMGYTGPLPTPVPGIERLGEKTVRCVTMQIKRTDQRDQEVHLYEAYWAPKTEGQVELRDVMRFLWNGGFGGLLKLTRPFHRYLFRDWQCFPGGLKTALYLSLALGALAALIVIDAIIAVAVTFQSAFLDPPPWMTETLFQRLSVAAALFTASAFAAGLLLFGASALKRAGRPGEFTWLAWQTKWAFLLLLAVTILAAWRMAWDVYRSVQGRLFPLDGDLQTKVLALALLTTSACLAAFLLVKAGGKVLGAISYHLILAISVAVSLLAATISLAFLPAVVQSALAGVPVFVGSGKTMAGLWSLLLVISWYVRKLLVQYPGDVAAYVASHRLDRFDELRQGIQELARESAEAIYLAGRKRRPGAGDFDFRFERIAVVGHSLGSVVAYDTLNRLINDDELTGGKLRVAERTCLFLTFGSPLDKTAFLFTAQGSRDAEIREALATLVQPLIQDYRHRTFPWVNVYSPSDIVSGELDFYDKEEEKKRKKENPSLPPPGTPPQAVLDVEDLDANIYLLAHTEYWGNQKVWEELYNRLV